MKINSKPTLARDLLFAAGGALLCAFASAVSPVAAYAAAAAPAAAPPVAGSEEVIIRAPDVIRRPLPRTGPGAPTGLSNPEIISLTRAVSYADLDLSKQGDQAEMRRRIDNTARDICLDLQRRFPTQGGQYVYANNDCVKKATDDGMATYNQIVATLTGR